MHQVTSVICTLADSISGYSSSALLEDLLASKCALVKLDEAAQAVQVARRTLERWIDAKELKSYRKDGCVRVNKYDVIRLFTAKNGGDDETDN